jgi:hypothetical protein
MIAPVNGAFGRIVLKNSGRPLSEGTVIEIVEIPSKLRCRLSADIDHGDERGKSFYAACRPSVWPAHRGLFQHNRRMGDAQDF